MFKDMLLDSPVRAAIKNDDDLEKCLKCESGIIFILYGDILSIGDIVSRVKEAGKLAFVHIDLIHGLYTSEVAVEYIKNMTRADGIISTKTQLIQKAKELGMYTVMRFFVIDSMALSNLKRQLEVVYPDCLEMLPGLMPKVVKKIVEIAPCPVIAGGLVSDREDVYSLLDAGASAISSTNHQVWFI